MRQKRLFDIFLNEKAIMAVILVNSATIFMQQSGCDAAWVNVLDVCCTLIFIVEFAVKHVRYGLRGYWRNAWNIMDGTLVLLSLPSLAMFFLPIAAPNLSSLLVLRLLRVLRFFRLLHLFPNIGKVMRNFGIALRESAGVLAGLLVSIIVLAMVSCSLFAEAAPELFGTPLDSIYTTFRLFTGEGWNEIPDTIAATMGAGWAHAVRIYFGLILLVGCIIGMSLLNSIFVDAMVSDNNDDLKTQLDDLKAQLDRMEKAMREGKE